MVEEAAVAGPSYALPAAPYGAPAAPQAAPRYADLDQRQDYDAPPPPVARRQTDPDLRQAYNAPRPQSRRVQQEQQEYLDEGWVYGPYGWVPPRPARRGWYQSGYDD